MKSATVGLVVAVLVAALAGVALVCVWGGAGLFGVSGPGTADEAALAPPLSPADGPSLPEADAPGNAAPAPLAPVFEGGTAGPTAPAAAEAPLGALRSGEIRARARSARTGSPLAGATLALVPADAPEPAEPTATSDPSGETGQVALREVAPGTYTLTVARPGCTPVVRSGVAIGAGVGIDLGDVALTPAAALTGTVRAGEHPAGGATVALVNEIALTFGPDMDIFKALSQLKADEQVFAVTAADAQGSYTFWWDEILPGDAVVRGVHTERATAFASVTLQPAAQPATQDLALPAPASLSGRVVDAAGVACRGCRVVVMPEPDPRLMMQRGKLVFFRTQTQTDAEGRFVVDVLQPGLYMVWAGGGEYATKMEERVRVPSADVEIRLLPALTLVGCVTDQQTGKPVAGAQVGAGGPGGFDVTHTDGEGRYRLSGLSGEELQVFVRAEGYAQVQLPAPGGEGEVVFDIPLGGGLSVSGRVVQAGNRRPVANATVLGLANGFDFGMGMPKTTTDAAGRFTLTGLSAFAARRGPAGAGPTRARFRVLVSAEGLLQPTPLELEVVPGEQPRNVEVVLEPAAIVEGRVVGPDGAPIAGARMVARQLEGGAAGQRDFELDWVLTMFDPAGAVTTDADGRFRLPSVRPGGRAQVAARHERYPTGRSAEFAAKAGTTVSGVTITLSAGAQVEVQATDEGGAPVEGVDLQLMRQPTPGADPSEELAAMDPAELMMGGAVRQVRTDGRGRAVLAGLAPGHYRLESDGPMVLAAPVAIDIDAPGTTRTVAVRLIQALAIRGVLRDAEGRPVAGAWAYAFAEDGGPVSNGGGQTNERGEFVIEGLAPGTYRVGGSGPDGAVAAEVSAAAGTTSVVLVLGPPGEARKR